MPALREAGVAADFLSPAAALDRFGVDLPDDAPLLHQPDAGVIHADRARRALLRIAAAAGAELHGDETGSRHGGARRPPRSRDHAP